MRPHRLDQIARILPKPAFGAALLFLISLVLSPALQAMFPDLAEAQPAPVLSESGMFVVGGEPKQLLPDPARDRLFVSDYSGGSVAEVDLGTGLVTRRLPAPGGPVGLALSQDGRTLFVGTYLEGVVYRYDLGTGRIEARSSGHPAPWDLRLVTGPGGRRLLAVTEHHGEEVRLLDTVTLAEEASLSTAYYPYEMMTDATGRLLYVASYGGRGGGSLQAYDLAALEEVWTVGTGRGSYDVLRAEDGRLLVGDFVGRGISVMGADGSKLDSWDTEGGPKELALSPGGESLFAALQNGDRLGRYDAETGALQGYIGTGSRPGPLAWIEDRGALTRPDGSGDGPRLAVGNQGDGTISILDSGAPTPEFADVPVSHRFHREIRALALRKALSGYERAGEAPLFQPEATLMRAQIAKILVGSLGLHTPEVERTQIFSDVTGGQEYPHDYVQEAVSAGIVRGFAGDPPRFGPYEPVTRVQLVRMLVRAAAALDASFPAPAGPSPFRDVGTGHPDYTAIVTAYEAGLVSGVRYPDGSLRFNAYSPATRGQTARMVFSFLAALHRNSEGG